MIRTAAPIIIIGSGRSGSSLLSRILRAHPEIAMFGELRFAVANTWQAMSEIFAQGSARRLVELLDNNQIMKKEAANNPLLIESIARDIEPDREQMRGRIVREAVVNGICLEGRPETYWGFKEIFNSGAADWSIYDAVFPEAQWVHIVRNPVEYARSAIWHSRQQLTNDTVVEHLQSWTAVFRMSRKRLDTGRFYEISYEQLIADPKQALTPFLDAIGIGWHERCEEAAVRQVGARSDRFEMPACLPSLIASVSELSAIMGELRYAPAAAALSGGPTRQKIETPCLIPVQDGRWQLSGPIWPEEGRAWQFDLDLTPLGAELAAISDRLDFWTRSPMQVFEDERPLGPGHSRHRVIRDTGNGAYSHWQGRLIFSTSDNSCPNENGRTYSFSLGE